MEEILTVQEVANYLRLSRTTVWRWCNQGKLPAFRLGRSWRIHRTDLDYFVRQGQEMLALEASVIAVVEKR